MLFIIYTSIIIYNLIYLSYDFLIEYPIFCMFVSNETCSNGWRASSFETSTEYRSILLLGIGFLSLVFCQFLLWFWWDCWWWWWYVTDSRPRAAFSLRCWWKSKTCGPTLSATAAATKAHSTCRMDRRWRMDLGGIYGLGSWGCQVLSIIRMYCKYCWCRGFWILETCFFLFRPSACCRTSRLGSCSPLPYLRISRIPPMETVAPEMMFRWGARVYNRMPRRLNLENINSLFYSNWNASKSPSMNCRYVWTSGRKLREE